MDERLRDIERQLKELKAQISAQHAMLCALAATHPQPGVLVEQFDKEAAAVADEAPAGELTQDQLERVHACLLELRAYIPGAETSDG